MLGKCEPRTYGERSKGCLPVIPKSWKGNLCLYLDLRGSQLGGEGTATRSYLTLYQVCVNGCWALKCQFTSIPGAFRPSASISFLSIWGPNGFYRFSCDV